MKFQEQKIKNFAGINELLTAQSNEFVECENVLNDVMQGELILNNIYKKEVNYTNYSDIDTTQLKTDHYVILEASKKYFVTIAQSVGDKTKALVCANGESVDYITNYDKDKTSIHQINQTLRISNGITSWFLGERDVTSGTTTTKQLYLEEQFKWNNANALIEITPSATSAVLEAGKYQYLVVYQLDGYQYVKVKTLDYENTKVQGLAQSFKVKDLSKRVTRIYMFRRSLITLDAFALVMDKAITDFTVVGGFNVYTMGVNTKPTLDTTSANIEKMITLLTDSKKDILSGTIYYNLDFRLNNAILSPTGDELMKYPNDTICVGLIGKQFDMAYKISENSNIAVKLKFGFEGGKKYKIRIKCNAVVPQFVMTTSSGGAGSTAIYYYYNYRHFDIPFSNTAEVGIEYKFNADNKEYIIDYIANSSAAEITFNGVFNHIYGTSDDINYSLLIKSKLNIDIPKGYLIFDILSVEEVNQAGESVSITSLTGYNIIPETRYVTGWSKALLTNNIVHYLNPVIERTDTDYKKNYIFRSEVSGSGAFMYDVAIEDPTQFLNLETFNGDEILTAEQLQNYDLLVFKKNSVLRVENTNRFAEVSNSHQITSKNSIHNDGGNIFFATQNGIFLTNGIEFTEISQKIKNSYLKLDRNNLILATDQLGRLHISDKKNKEYIFTKGGWIKSDKIFTFFYKFNLLYCMSNYQIFSSDIILDEANKAKRINILTAPFDLLMLDGVEHNMRVVIRSIWNNLEYQSGDAKIYLKIDGKSYKEVPLQENWRLFPIPNAKKVQIGIKGTFSEFRLKSLGFMWKPMLIGDRG